MQLEKEDEHILLCIDWRSCNLRIHFSRFINCVTVGDGVVGKTCMLNSVSKVKIPSGFVLFWGFLGWFLVFLLGFCLFLVFLQFFISGCVCYAFSSFFRFLGLQLIRRKSCVLVLGVSIFTSDFWSFQFFFNFSILYCFLSFFLKQLLGLVALFFSSFFLKCSFSLLGRQAIVVGLHSRKKYKNSCEIASLGCFHLQPSFFFDAKDYQEAAHEVSKKEEMINEEISFFLAKRRKLNAHAF